MVSLGDACVGKSCLIKRYCEKKFVPKYISTIGVDFGVRQVRDEGGLETKVNFYDLSGAPEMSEVRREFHRDAQGLMLVYDVSEPASFASLSRWMIEHRECGGNPSIVLLCANKVDGEPASAAARKVSEAEGRKYAATHGFTYMETSAKSGANVDAMFAVIFKGIADKR